MNHFLAALVLAIGVVYSVYLHHEQTKAEIQIQHQNRIELETLADGNADRYEFRYVGKEGYSNVFATYRLDKRTGAAERLSYTAFPKDKDGTPQYDQVGVLNMQTGIETTNISSSGLATLTAHWEKQAEEDAKRAKKKE